MKITSAKFMKGIVQGDVVWSQTHPHIAFYGRSNAGKSSTINALANNKTLAKTSALPGKTRQLNLFLLNDSLYFVDLPGYGYAKLSKKEKEKIQELIFWFMLEVQIHRRVHVLITDAKVGLTDLDKEILELVERSGEPVILLLNKTDKLKQNEIAKAMRDAQAAVRTENVHILPFSARTKKGVTDFWKTLNGILR